MSKKYKKILLDHEISLLDNDNLQDHTHANARSVILLGPSIDTEKFAQTLFVETSSLSPSSKNLINLVANKWMKKHRVKFHLEHLVQLYPEFLSTMQEMTNKRAKKNGCENDHDDKSSNNAKLFENLFTAVYRPVGDDELNFMLTHNQLPSTQPYQAIMADEPGRAYAERYVDGTKRVDTSPSTVVEIIAPTLLIKKLFERQQKPEDGCLSHGLGFAAGKDLNLLNDWMKAFASEKVFEQIDEYDERLFVTEDDDDDENNDQIEKQFRAEEDIFAFRRAFRIVKVKRKIP